MRILPCLPVFLLASVAATQSGSQPATQPGSQPAYASNPAFQKARAEAKRLSASPQDRMFAAQSWRKANVVAGGHCMECFSGMINGSMSTGDYKPALKAAEEMEAAATTPVDKSTAEFYEGKVLMAQAGTDKPKPALLEQAHAAFVKSIESDKSNANSYFLDGKTLAYLNRTSEASAAFESYVKNAPRNSTLLVRAQHFAAKPELARLTMAPPVVVTTASGRTFNLDNMGGRVVLIDFWATWCGPCNKELPHLQKLAKQFEGQPFEIISVSSDRDEAKWKEFIASHGMIWNQYRDADDAVGRAFAVRAIPHYFIIDSDGVLTSEDIGTDNNIDSKLKKLVKRAAESGAKSTSELAAMQPAQAPHP